MVKLKGLNFLFQNQNFHQVVLKNSFWLLTAELVSRGFKFILIMYTARILGAYQYGQFAFLLNLAALLIILAEFGLPLLVTREFSKERENKQTVFDALLGLKLALSFLLLLIIGFLSLFLNQFELKITLLVLGFYLIIDNFSQMFVGYFRSQQKMQHEAMVRITGICLTVVFGFFVLYYRPSIQNLSFAYALGAFLALILAGLIYRFFYQSFRLKIDLTIWKEFIRLAWPLVLISAFLSLYQYSDSVMLGLFHLIKDNGFYNAAYKILDLAVLPIALITSVFFPIISSLNPQKNEENKKQLNYVFSRYFAYSLGLMVFITLSVFFLAPLIIFVVYGVAYQPSLLALQILLLANIAIYLSWPFNNLLIAFNYQKQQMTISSIGALINIILNLILIPKFSLYGAALATAFTYFLVGLMSYLMAKNKLKFILDKKLILKSSAIGFILALFIMTLGFFIYSYT